MHSKVTSRNAYAKFYIHPSIILSMQLITPKISTMLKSAELTFHHHAKCNKKFEVRIIGISLQAIICSINNMSIMSASAPVVNCALQMLHVIISQCSIKN